MAHLNEEDKGKNEAKAEVPQDKNREGSQNKKADPKKGGKNNKTP